MRVGGISDDVSVAASVATAQMGNRRGPMNSGGMSDDISVMTGVSAATRKAGGGGGGLPTFAEF